MSEPIRVGTRASALARTQTATVSAALERVSGRACREVLVRTTGDDTSRPLDQLGQGVFVSALRTALLAGDVDVVVHSYKDLPSAPEEGVLLAAVPVRADPRDVLVSRRGTGLLDLPPGSVVGTSSPRRRSALLRLRPDLVVVPLRGNVDSRVRQVREGALDAAVLALAGLERLGRADEATEVLDVLPAPAQGALAVECRADDAHVREWLARLDDPLTRLTTTAERHVLVGVGATCTTAVAAWAHREGELLRLQAELTDEHGRLSRADVSGRCRLDDQAGAAALGLGAAADLHGANGAPPVLLVRDGAADPDLAALAVLGLPAVSDPYVRVTGSPDPAAARNLLAHLGRWAGSAPAVPRWLVVTSAHAVPAWQSLVGADALRSAVAAAARAGVRLAAVGPRSAQTLADLGVSGVVVPEHASAAGLLERLGEEPPGEVLLPLGDLALPTLREGLTARGWGVHAGVVYRTHAVADPPASVPLVAAGAVSAVVLRSPSAARALASFVRPAVGVAVVCAGATTAQAAREQGLRVADVAAAPSPEAVATCVRQALASP
jgi:hydroxymethylbilane synthase